MNIWSIKSKSIRAAVAWLIAGVGAVLVLVAMPIALACLAAAGVWGGVTALWRCRTDIAPLWRAMTGREAV